LIGSGEYVLESSGSAGSGNGDNALVVAGICEPVELAAVLESHGDTARAGKLNDFLNAGILAAFGDDDTVKGTAGFEGFANRVNAGETVHGELQFSVASLQFTVQRRQFTAAVDGGDDGKKQIPRRGEGLGLRSFAANGAGSG
jgi:hypothetical protein